MKAGSVTVSYGVTGLERISSRVVWPLSFDSPKSGGFPKFRHAMCVFTPCFKDIQLARRLHQVRSLAGWTP
jgi:hypothetical protein